MRAKYFLTAALSLRLGGCSDKTNPRVETKLNREAALMGELPSNPLQGRVITSWIDATDSTMSTLFGNDVAVIMRGRMRRDDVSGWVGVVGCDVESAGGSSMVRCEDTGDDTVG